MAVRPLLCKMLLILSLACATTAGYSQARAGRFFYTDLVYLIQKAAPQSCNVALEVTLMLDTSQSMDGTLKETFLQAWSKIGRYYLREGDLLRVVPFDKRMYDSQSVGAETFRNESAFFKSLSDLFVRSASGGREKGKLFYTPQVSLMESLKQSAKGARIPVGIVITNINSGSLEMGQLPREDRESLARWQEQKERFALAEQSWEIAQKSDSKPLSLHATLFLLKNRPTYTQSQARRRQLYRESSATEAPILTPTHPYRGAWGLALLSCGGGSWCGYALLRRRSRIRLQIGSLLSPTECICDRAVSRIRLISYHGTPLPRHATIEILDDEGVAESTLVTKNDLFLDIPSVSDMTPRLWLQIQYDGAWIATPSHNHGVWKLEESVQFAPVTLAIEQGTELVAEPRDNRRYILCLQPLDDPRPAQNRHRVGMMMFIILTLVFALVALQEPTNGGSQTYTSSFSDLCRP